MKAVLAGKPGRPKKGEETRSDYEPNTRGDKTDYTLARLKRDHPESDRHRAGGESPDGRQ